MDADDFSFTRQHSASGIAEAIQLFRTQRVWRESLAGGYIAQRLAPPSERRVAVDGQRSDLKLDVRAYAYAGTLRLVAARLYRGQTTNFRTPGGGFAPVFVTGAKGRPW